jgi:hypothetical protein
MELLTVPVIIALVEMLKSSGMPSRFAPLAALAIGITLGLAWGSFDLNGLTTGLLLGLSASGLYSGQKAVRGL